MLYSLALLALVAPTDAISWTKGTTGTCAGISDPCTGAAQCTAAYIGPCDDATTGADKYIMQYVEGPFFASALADYVSNPSHFFVEAVATGPGYRDFEETETEDGKPYVYSMTGNLFGNYTKFGSYIGVSAAFNTGNQAISITTTSVYTSHPSSPAQVQRGGSSIGAPNGPYTICIEEEESVYDTTCGSTQSTFAPGAFKFSIFGYTWEALGTAGTADGYYYGSTHSARHGNKFGFYPEFFGVRQKLTAVGFTPSDVSFNNGAFTLAGLNDQDITQMTATLATGKTISWTFPPFYRWGTFAAPGTPYNPDSTATAGAPGSTATSDFTSSDYLLGGGSVKIKVQQVPGEPAFYVDYLFDANQLETAGQWFAYDPDIETAGGTAVSMPAEDPCFPSSAMVTMADGTVVRVDTLKEGDEIVSTTVDGALTTDMVSLLSIAKPEVSELSFLSLTTTSNATIRLTTDHHLPVGKKCCSTLKKAKDIAVGEEVWAVTAGKAVATAVVAKAVTTAAGLHSPVMSSGTFPVVDGVVTSFDSIEKVTLAKHGLGPLLTACKATGTCDTFRDLFLGDDK